jgi:hypothetical protein
MRLYDVDLLSCIQITAGAHQIQPKDGYEA